ncbi:hypothetical protein LVISKB_0528 [Levilactobacillus brevis KB290]|uniref:Uncharacterized protein n=1 Tax=Levilactobacillus brevis KB290 TaxID=1001583 RepID=M5ABI4_LEVBR|nr:hypothetical protein LVISKB_0528 [Levilactobacillus brevis KB290]
MKRGENFDEIRGKIKESLAKGGSTDETTRRS